MSRYDRFYLFVTVFLLIAATTGAVMLAVQHGRSQPVEIALSHRELPEQSGQVYISGAVANPGIYPWRVGDTIQALLLSARAEPDADFSRIDIHIPREGEKQSAQKIDINRAEPWLLKALPGIGEELAQRIVDYRRQNGPFRTIGDLLKVRGIGTATFEKLRDYITVSD